MKLVEKTERWGKSHWEGKKNRYKVTVAMTGNAYYYYLERKEDDKRHNSLWTGSTYGSKEEAAEASEQWINKNGR